MQYIDVFNGDADGLCALHQLRLKTPVTSTLVTGFTFEKSQCERRRSYYRIRYFA